jgi:DNA-binding Lrp family transcriptional regulator
MIARKKLLKLLQNPANRYWKSYSALGKKIGVTKARAKAIVDTLSEYEVQKLDGFNLIPRGERGEVINS